MLRLYDLIWTVIPRYPPHLVLMCFRDLTDLVLCVLFVSAVLCMSVMYGASEAPPLSGLLVIELLRTAVKEPKRHILLLFHHKIIL